MKITVKEVAQAAGVSSATASRVLGNYGYVSEEVRTNVLEVARKLGYRPHALAKSLVKGETKTVGFVVGDIENPFFASLAKYVNALISLQGFTLMVYTTDENTEEEIKGVESLISKQVDGLIIAPSSSKDISHIIAAQNSGISVVLVDRPLPNVRIDSVSVDNTKGMYEAVRYLIEIGHKEIGFISDSLDIGSNQERLLGYYQAYTEAGLTTDENLIKTTGYTVMDGYRGAVGMLSNQNKPSAVVTANNFMTIGFMLASRDMNLNIPEHISLIGFDDLDWYKLTNPPISAISQPIKRIGQEVSRLLLSRMAAKGEITHPESIVLATHLTHRNSTRKIK
ncbi:MAG: LacI family DNA-binding transcriptional regulator [Anaerolineaceae bacterium]